MAVTNMQSSQQKTESYHGIIHFLGDRMPWLVILYMSMIAVVRPVTHPPPMIGFQYRWVCDVTNKIIQSFAVAEALVTTAVTTGPSVQPFLTTLCLWTGCKSLYHLPIMLSHKTCSFHKACSLSLAVIRAHQKQLTAAHQAANFRCLMLVSQVLAKDPHIVPKLVKKAFNMATSRHAEGCPQV